MTHANNMDKGGLILGYSKNQEKIYFIEEDTHSLIIGATRSGKTRCLILPSIGLTGLAGESMVIVDPKGENYAYTHPFLEREGYECITLDFTNPSRSNRYNYLQPCIDAANKGNPSLIVTAARDIATILIQSGSHTDAIWTDGARAVMTLAILAVVIDNQDNPEYQNLANVQQFIANMCKPIGRQQRLPLEVYIDRLPEDHPVRFAMGISNLAPDKMRSSFYSQVLVALDMFIDPDIHSMTAMSDFDLEATGLHKRAIFIILPDQKKTYHPLAALFIQQHYQLMVEVGNRRGGRLVNRIQFFCDEFGNFVKIPDFDVMLTVGGGRGMRFHIALQDVNQLDEKYGDKHGKTIRANCETWVYLQTDDPGTLRELSDKCGKYTIKSPSLSGSSSGQSSASYNLTGRNLLMPEEVAKIKRPYQLVTSRVDPAVMFCPDISKTIFQGIFGLGNPDHNRQLIAKRQTRRPSQPANVNYWTDCWNDCIAMLQATANNNENEY